MSDQNAMDLDSYAKKQGYPDYATMRAYMAHRSDALRQNTTTTQVAPPQSNVPPPPTTQALSPYQRLMRAFGAPGY